MLLFSSVHLLNSVKHFIFSIVLDEIQKKIVCIFMQFFTSTCMINFCNIVILGFIVTVIHCSFLYNC